MNKDVAVKLKETALECGKRFSDPNREFNSNNETFELQELISLGDALAAGVYKKSSGKKALVVFVYVKSWWIYFFPNSAHLLGWDVVKDLYFGVERENFVFNFVDEKKGLSDFV